MAKRRHRTHAITDHARPYCGSSLYVGPSYLREVLLRNRNLLHRQRYLPLPDRPVHTVASLRPQQQLPEWRLRGHFVVASVHDEVAPHDDFHPRQIGPGRQRVSQQSTVPVRVNELRQSGMCVLFRHYFGVISGLCTQWTILLC
jgi:hypothetical protein